MFYSDEIEKYDPSHRIVLYDVENDGKCIPKIVEPEIAKNDVDKLYEARSIILKNTLSDLLEGKISPILFYFINQRMDMKDFSRRVKLSVSTVKKHFSLKGFMKISVKELHRYAQVFDIAVGDFFSFIKNINKVEVIQKKYHDRLIEHIEISAKK